MNNAGEPSSLFADQWCAASVLACGLVLLAAGSLLFLVPMLAMVFCRGRGPRSRLIGLLLIVMAQGLPLILVGGVFVTLGWAMIGSTATALAMDLSNPESRGRNMATFSVSFQIGAGVGAIIAGALADLVGLRGMYAGSIVITLAGFGLLAGAWKGLPRPARH